MTICGEYIRSQFPALDDDLYQYVEGMFREITYKRFSSYIALLHAN
jgi:hypothetical protein